MIEMLHMIKSRITLKQLEAFAYVVDSGTFRAAAAALGTTQPNISARITALETALKVTLLIRDAGSVRLTAGACGLHMVAELFTFDERGLPQLAHTVGGRYLNRD
jgi:DNA-binding transcriptional LysR family regulator